MIRGGSRIAGLVTAAASIFGVASDAWAANIVLKFSGTTSVTMDGVPAGTPFTGTFAYDPGASAPLGDVPFYGGTKTVYQDAYHALTLTIGANTVRETVPGVITLYDNVNPPSGVPVGDSMYTFTPGGGLPNPSTGSFVGLTPNFIYLGFVDHTGSAFAGPSLPSTLHLGSFTSVFVGVNFHPYGAGNTTVISSITSLTPVPEPAAWALMAAGLATLGLVVGRRRA